MDEPMAAELSEPGVTPVTEAGQETTDEALERAAEGEHLEDPALGDTHSEDHTREKRRRA